MHRMITGSPQSALHDAGESSASLPSRYEAAILPGRSPPLVTGVLSGHLTTLQAVEDMTSEALKRGVERSILLHSGAHGEASIAAIQERLPHSAVAHRHIARDAPSLEDVRALHELLQTGATMVAAQNPALVSLLKPMMEQRALAEEAVRLGEPCHWRKLNDAVMSAPALTGGQRDQLRQHAHQLIAEVELRLRTSPSPKGSATTLSQPQASAADEEPIYAVVLGKSKRAAVAARPASPVAEDGAPGRSAARAPHPAEAIPTPPSWELEGDYASISPYAEPPELPPRPIEAPIPRAASAADGAVIGGPALAGPFKPLPALPGKSAPAQAHPDALPDLRLDLGVQTLVGDMVKSFLTTRAAGTKRFWKNPQTFGSPVAVRELQADLATYKREVGKALLDMRKQATDMSDDAFATALRKSIRQSVSSEVLSPKDEKRLKKRVRHENFTDAMLQVSTKLDEDRLALKTAVHDADRPARLRVWLEAVFDRAVLEGLMDAGAKAR